MIRSSSGSPTGDSSSVLSGLTDEQQERLADLLDRYLVALESGAPLDADQLSAAQPDLAEAFRRYLARLDELHQASAAFADRAESAPAELVDAQDGARRRLGDFILGDEIGRGGMGVVYEARQISLDRRVALKVLPFSAVLDGRQIARFRNEAKAAAQLQHPHIVPVYAVGAERGVHYYAMQLIDGRPLDTIVTQLRNNRQAPSGTRNTLSTLANCKSSTLDQITSGSLSHGDYYSTVARLGREAAAALDAAHQEGVVHRDIKPSNLLIDDNGKLWVTDFGLARMHSDAALSRSGDIVGTWRYMSPEQARGESALVDHRTDIYSLGVTLWELLALEPLYSGDDRATKLRQLDQDDPPRLLHRCPGLPPDLETVVLKAMARRREDRYETAAEFALDLGRVLEGKPTMARPPSLTDRMTRWARRHQRFLTVVAACGLLLLGVSTSAAFVALRERGRADESAKRAERNYREARQVVDRLGAHYADRLTGLAGAESLRHDLMTETLGYYQDFVRESRDDPGLQADIALTFSKIGSLVAALGSTDQALDANRQAVRRFELLLADQPRSFELRQDAAIAQRQLGESLRAVGDLDLAKIACDEAVRLNRDLLVERPDDQTLSSEMTLAMDALALVHVARRETSPARDLLLDSIRIGRQLCADHPKNSELRRRLAASLNRLGQLHVDRRPADSLVLHQQALAELEFVAGQEQLSSRSSRELAMTHDHLGAAHYRMKNWNNAIAAYQQAIETRRPIARIQSSSLALKLEMAASCNNLGLAQIRGGQCQAAIESCRESIDWQESVVAARPDDPAARSNRGSMWNNLAIAQERSDQLESAVQSFQQAIVDQRLAYQSGRKVDYHRDLLTRHYAGLCRVLRLLGREEEAEAAERARQQHWTSADELDEEMLVIES